MIALLTLTLLGADPATAEKALLMPIQAAASVTEQAASLPLALEDALARALARHASFQVVRRADVATLLGSAAQSELAGCDADACMAQVADALGARFLVATQLDHVNGNWLLQATLLDRVTAVAVRRSDVRVGSMEALFLGVDQVARNLAGGTTLALADPQLATRLATTPQGADRLRAEAVRHPERSVSDVWTDLLVDSNRESELLPLAQGALLLAAGVLMASAFIVANFAGLYAAVSIPNRGLEPDLFMGNARTDATYPFQVIRLSFFLLAPFAFAPSLALVSLAVALGAVDALDLHRIPVGPEGCCRDEPRLRDAARPTWRTRAAVALAVAGGGFAMGSLLVGLLSTIPVVLVYSVAVLFNNAQPPNVPQLPSVQLGFWPGVAVLGGLYVMGALNQLVLLGVGVTAGVIALVMLAHERVSLVDERAVTPVNLPAPAAPMAAPAPVASPPSDAPPTESPSTPDTAAP